MRFVAVLTMLWQIESLAYDLDYKGKFSRAEFEAACKDLKLRFAVPILEALAHAGLKLVRSVHVCDDVVSWYSQKPRITSPPSSSLVVHPERL